MANELLVEVPDVPRHRSPKVIVPYTDADGLERRRVIYDYSEHESDKEKQFFANRTKPEFAKESDINAIMKKYRKTGILGDPLTYGQGMYGDFSSGEDFADVMRKIADVNQIFSELPSEVRTRFANNPKNMIDFLVDPANDEEAIKMGLKRKVEAPPVPQPVPPAPPAPVPPPVNPPGVPAPGA